MIYLMRHGQDDETFIGGWSNVDLTELGITQVKDASKWISNNLNISEIVCSDVYRAFRTASIVNEELGVHLRTDSNLREQSKGLLNGMVKSDAFKLYGDLLNNVSQDTIYPQGESLEQLYLRISEYLKVIMSFKDNTLIVTHRGVINMIYYLLNDISLDMNKERFGVTPASIHELDKNKNVLRKVR